MIPGVLRFQKPSSKTRTLGLFLLLISFCSTFYFNLGTFCGRRHNMGKCNFSCGETPGGNAKYALIKKRLSNQILANSYINMLGGNVNPYKSKKAKVTKNVFAVLVKEIAKS